MNPNYPGKSRDMTVPYMIVLASGLATTALTLLLVYWLDDNAHFNLMGFYLDYILPAGAILVGILAGSGYGLASWLTGVKIPRTMIWTVLALQCIAYFSAQYIVFAHLHLVNPYTNQPVGFLQYFDWAARNFSFKKHNGEPGEPFGTWGYAYRFLELAGFAFAGVLIPALVMVIPYCDPCGRYMRRTALATLPGSIRAKQPNRKDAQAVAAYEEEKEQADASAKQAIAVLGEMAASGQTGALSQALAALGPGSKAAAKLPSRYVMSLYLCPACPAGRLKVVPMTGQGKKVRQGTAIIFEIPGERTDVPAP